MKHTYRNLREEANALCSRLASSFGTPVEAAEVEGILIRPPSRARNAKGRKEATLAGEVAKAKAKRR